MLILTTRDDFVSNQIAFLSVRKRFGVGVMQRADAAGRRRGRRWDGPFDAAICYGGGESMRIRTVTVAIALTAASLLVVVPAFADDDMSSIEGQIFDGADDTNYVIAPLRTNCELFTMRSPQNELICLSTLNGEIDWNDPQVSALPALGDVDQAQARVAMPHRGKPSDVD
jgi:hypothetical protein